MKPAIIVDAGPLVAYFDRDADQHLWVREQADQLPPGWLTSEAVLGETAHLLRRAGVAPEQLLALVEEQLLRVPFHLEDEFANCADCCDVTAIGRCRWPMRLWSGCRNSTRTARC